VSCDYNFKPGWSCSRDKGHKGPCALTEMREADKIFAEATAKLTPFEGRMEQVDPERHTDVYFRLTAWDMIRLLVRHRVYYFHVKINWTKQKYTITDGAHE
jgi:hypothetical protein